MPTPIHPEPFTQEDGRLVWRGHGETLVVQPWGPDSVRVRSRLSGDVLDNRWALLDPEQADAEITIDAAQPGSNRARAELTNGGIRVVLSSAEYFDWQAGYVRSSCSVAIYRGAELMLQELTSGGALKRRARHFEAEGATHRLTAAFTAPASERLHGMGLYQDGLLDFKGATVELAHRNSQASVPFVVSSAGYGFLWHNPAIGRATFAVNRTEWVAQATDQLDYWVTVGHTPGEIARNYARATGSSPMMPESGLGFWQCKLRYASQEELLQVAREHRRRGLPLDVIVADFFHWPKMGDFRWEEEFWPDPQAMIAELNELGIELMVSVWPQVSHSSENYAELDRRGFLVRSDRGVDVQMSFEGPSRFLDVTNPQAREWLAQALARGYPGVKMFWLDEAEPEYASYDFAAYRYHLGPALQVGNVYPQLFSSAVADVRQEVAGGGSAPLHLVRCAWAGSQRHGALVWSGDIHSSFDTMRSQITAGINMGAAGIPWFTTDIGGFMGGNTDDPEFHELLIRWFQMAAFMPVMRLHGDRGPQRQIKAADGSRRCHSGAGNELWSFGPEVFEVLQRYVFLRESMREYLRSVMLAAHTDGAPVMRGLFHDFFDDDVAVDIDDQFMLGADVLVAPIVQAGGRSRSVYLPGGTRWRDWSGGQVYAGGQWLEVAAPLDVIPVFVRDGALPDLTAP